MADDPQNPPDTQPRNWLRGYLYWFGVTAVVMLASIYFQYQIAQFLKTFPPYVAGFCKNAPYSVGLLVMMVIWLGYRMASGQWSPLPLVQGEDKRMSTSKAQLFLWTVVALFSYVSFTAARIGAGDWELGDLDVPGNLIMAMGLSLGTATAASAITARQVARGEVSKTPADSDKPEGGLVTDDKGEVDLQKAQMIGWTVIAVLAYLTNLGQAIDHIGVSGMNDIKGLPDIDNSLMVLMGLGQGSYLGSKLILTGSAVLESIALTSAGTATLVTLTGKNLGTATGSLRIDGVAPDSGVMIKTWTDSSIGFTIPPESRLQGHHRISVVTHGKETNALDLEVLRKPQITAIEAVSGRDGMPLLNVKGFAFGDAATAGVLSVADKPVGEDLQWQDMSISGRNPDAVALKPGASVKVAIYLGSDKTPTVSQTLTIA